MHTFIICNDEEEVNSNMSILDHFVRRACMISLI